MNTAAEKLAGALDRHRVGDLKTAAEFYRDILRDVSEQAPEHVEALHMLGVAATQNGAPDEATQLIGRAIALDASKPKYHYHLGEALRVRGKFEPALASYTRAVELDPAFGDAYNAIGITNLALDRAEAAADALERAGQLTPADSRTHANLGMARRKLGQADAALVGFARALQLAPADPVYQRYFTATLEEIDDGAVPSEVRDLLETGLRSRHFAGQGLVGPAAAVLRRAAWLAPLAATAWADDFPGLATAIADGTYDEMFRDTLLVALLECAVVADPDLEMGLAAIRRAILKSTQERNLVLERVFALHPSFVAAMATNGFNTDYAWLESFEEATAADHLARGLARRLRSPEPLGPADQEVEFWSMAVLYGCYRPLHLVAGADKLVDLDRSVLPPFLRRRVDQQIDAPNKERRLAVDLAQVTAIEDPRAAQTGRRHDRFLHPRWTAARSPRPATLRELARSIAPSIGLPAFADGPIRLLVPGCGTGRHAVDLAQRLPEADIWAIDLSRGSLAYGARLASELGVTNVTFAQGDIFELGDLDRRFHVISLAGVLHRLVEPLAAWRILADLLEPNGLMQVALQSAAGRAPLAPIRQAIAERGIDGDNAAGLRLGRLIVRDLPRQGAARHLLRATEFYSLGGCRDLLVPRPEHGFTLPGFGHDLATLGLELIGLEMTDPRALVEYGDRFPQDRDRIDLDRWHAIERDHPGSFFGTYRIWCRKSDGAG